MRVLQVHNYYREPGGEDVVFENEAKLLATMGHEVIQYKRYNSEIDKYNLVQRAGSLLRIRYSNSSYKDALALMTKIRPDVCHVHNTFALISPSIYYACNYHGIPVVQTLHNYRLLCTNATLYLNGAVCEDCLGKNLYRSVRRRCYRSSKIHTLVVANLVESHRRKGTWATLVDRYIVLTNFSKNKFIEGGLPGDKIEVKPNFLVEPPQRSFTFGRYFLFAGRLDAVKGIETLIEAHRRIREGFHLVIAGEGPMRPKIQSYGDIRYDGRLKHGDLMERMKSCYCLIFPSLWYEGMPMTVLEAFACGKPVIASKLGAMKELVQHGKTGLLFNPGDVDDLEATLRWAIGHKDEMRRMGDNARKEYEAKYTASRNYTMLIELYERTIASKVTQSTESIT